MQNNSNIDVLIPQKEPFVMISELVSFSSSDFSTVFNISKNNILCENNCFTTEGLLENIAQSCAAGLGKLQQAQNTEPRIGYIGAINKVVLHNLPPIEAKLETFCSIITEFKGVILIAGKSSYNSIECIECEMKIVLANA